MAQIGLGPASGIPPPEPKPPIRVGVLHSRTGSVAITEKPAIDATLLAIEEINRGGGRFGRRVEPVVVDDRSAGPAFARGAEWLLARKQVVAVFDGIPRLVAEPATAAALTRQLATGTTTSRVHVGGAYRRWH